MKGFDFDVAKAEQIFDLLLKEKQLKLPENHKLPTAQELQGRLYCKWHHSFTHAMGECKELRCQIQSAIEQGRLILSQHTMKVDTKPFPQANVVELSDFTPTGQNFSFQINMAGPVRRRDEQRREAVSSKRPQDQNKPGRQHITEEQVCHIRNQLPASDWLLENMNISTSCVADINRKKRSTSTAHGGRWGGARLYATTGIARSSGTTGTPA